MLHAPSTSPARASRAGSTGHRLRLWVALTALLGVSGYLLFHYLTGPSAEGCTFRVGAQRVELDVTQAANAATIAAVAAGRQLPERAVTIAVATAMQESQLENISHGDRDSLGLFQQRPSQGWGTEKQIMDPVYSANAFFEVLEDVPGYSRLPLTVAAQKVQRSGYPQAYAKHEPEAAVVAAALTGREAESLVCRFNTGGEETAGDPARVADRLSREFGESAGAVRRSGQQVRLGPTASGGDSERRGWALAHWAVSHAKELRIERVAYGNREWIASDSGDGWQKNANESADNSADRVLITVAKN